MLVYTCELMGLFQWGIRQSCEVENLVNKWSDYQEELDFDLNNMILKMTSVERLLEYVSLPSENDPEEQKKTNSKERRLKQDLKNWPTKGAIRFENVSFSYDSSLPNVLNDLSFTINAGEKIGIVGRTGVGKSSIIQTLFRMAEPNGKILIDDVNIKDISLHDLRSKIAIIPVSLVFSFFKILLMIYNLFNTK